MHNVIAINTFHNKTSQNNITIVWIFSKHIRNVISMSNAFHIAVIPKLSYHISLASHP